ncbi:hypothetical protein [Haloarchaeobius sp. DFWS5]|uniref:hypothetical protein n=1 Tax=Haloarchaeobius sp. DFWS5 TaxID=3446114 RepID=UPI003EBB9B0F
MDVEVVDESLEMKPDDDPLQNALFRLLGAFAEFEAEMARSELVKESRPGCRTT